MKSPKTRCNNSWTEARFWGFIRTALRQAHMRWDPAWKAKKAAERKNQSNNKKLKYEYQCANCKRWFPGKETHIDHIIPCGSLKCYDDLADFVRRLFCEMDGYQVLCKSCHHEEKK